MAKVNPNPNPLPTRIGFGSGSGLRLLAAMLLMVSVTSLPVSALQIPSIASIRSSLGGDSLLKINKNTAGPVFKYGRFELKPYDFLLEFYLFSICFSYLFLAFLGKLRNKRLVSKWLESSLQFLQSEFSVIANGEGGDNVEKSLWNGGGQAVVYATGRRSVEGMQAMFTLIPYHDPFLLITNFISDIVSASITSSSQDLLTLSFNLPSNSNGIFAICKKTNLRSFRKSRFDLTFSKVNDSTDFLINRGLNEEWVWMSEHSELTDQILGETGSRGDERRNMIGLSKALNGQDGRVLQSLCLTDFWEAKPEEAASLPPLPPRRLILTLNLPKTQSEIESSQRLITLALNLCDGFNSNYIKLKADTISKMIKSREEVKKELQDRWDKWEREEAEEARQKAKREAEALKLAKLSPAEQEKRKKVEQKRAMKKAQGKQMKVR